MSVNTFLCVYCLLYCFEEFEGGMGGRCEERDDEKKKGGW